MIVLNFLALCRFKRFGGYRIEQTAPIIETNIIKPITTMENLPFQINYAIKKDGQGRTTETSLLLNIRGSQLPIVVSNFVSLQNKVCPGLVVPNLPKLTPASPQVAVAERIEQQRPEYPGACDVCGAGMILKTARKGSRAGQRFWSCSSYQSLGCLF